MRGTDNVGAEWADIQAAVEEVKAHEVEFWKSLAVLFSPRFWKLALASVAIPFFQQFTGMNAIMFYGALFFPSLFLANYPDWHGIPVSIAPSASDY